MRAYVLHRYGGKEAMEMGELPVPEAGHEEVRIRVCAVGLNPVDRNIREGKARLLNRLKLPIAAGSELSGIVETVGSGLKGLNEGDHVFARVDMRKLGAFAEYAVVHGGLVAKMPRTMDFEHSAGLPLAGTTALQALRDDLKVSQGDRVFISGGAGGVGTLAIQIAKYLGAEVTTTASERGEELVRRMGADHVINYKREDFSRKLRDYDSVLDLTGGDDLLKSFSIVKRGGTVLSLAGVPDAASAREDLGTGRLVAFLFRLASAKLRRRARKHDSHYKFMFMRPNAMDLEFLAGLVDGKSLTVPIDRAFSFEQFPEAFACLEEGRAKGKIIVRIQ